MNKNSYTSANEFPYKLMFQNFEDKIKPIHIQLCPTNKCNQNCLFCSCKNRDKTEELSLEQIKSLIVHFSEFGTKSVTITGGGESLLHPEIDSILDLFVKAKIKTGLVTNGFLLPELGNSIEKCEWIRISLSKEIDYYRLDKILNKVICFETDWAFSYVVQDEIEINSIVWAINYANKNNFTHIRLVNDLMNLPISDPLPRIKDMLQKLHINDEIVIYQPRKEFALGEKQCLISLLKPLIGADGFVYPCCGVQYADSEPEANFPVSMRMGRIESIPEIWEKQLFFDGSNCKRCYYGQYNKTLEKIKSLGHKEFV